MKAWSLCLAASIALALPAAPALAALPDYEATPYECADFDAAANTCGEISWAEFDTPDSGTNSSVADFFFVPSQFGALDANGQPLPSAVLATTISTPFTIESGDRMCSDYAAATFDIVPKDPATPAAVVNAFRTLLTAGFATLDSVCATYTPNGDTWIWQMVDETGPIAGSEQPLTMLTEAQRANVTLREAPF